MRVHLRVPTKLGPRTIVVQKLAEAEAYAFADTVRNLGGEAFICDDGGHLTVAQILAMRNPSSRVVRFRGRKVVS